MSAGEYYEAAKRKSRKAHCLTGYALQGRLQTAIVSHMPTKGMWEADAACRRALADLLRKHPKGAPDAAADIPAGDNAVERAFLTRATLCRVSVATVAMQRACEGRRVCAALPPLADVQVCLCKNCLAERTYPLK